MQETCNRKLPERDAIYYIYDHGDHQVLSQDGEQRVRGEWAFPLSDELDRPVLTGICHNSYYYDDFPLCETDVKARRDDTDTAFHGYILENIPLTNPEVYTVNYYDDYSFIGKHGVPTSLNYVTPPSGYGTCYTESSKGLLTGTVTARMDATGVTGYDYVAFYYDERGRIIQSRATNHMGGIEEEYVAYSFTGELMKRQHVHTATGKSTQTEECTYEYDHAGRLSTTRHKLNTNEEVTLVENIYDDLGRIKSSKRHGNSALATDYTYNVRSWMKTLTTDTLLLPLYCIVVFAAFFAEYIPLILGHLILRIMIILLGAILLGIANILTLFSLNYVINNVEKMRQNISF